MTRSGGEADRQLPLGEEIFLDHVAHFVPDREAARAALARAGFAPAPVSIQVNPDPAGGPPQPTGTGNVTAMLARGYVEILFKTADTPLGRELDAALARHPGLHLAAFAVADARAAHHRLGEAGFRMQPLVEMQRPVDTVQGRMSPPSRSRASHPGRWPRAASRCSPTAPSTPSGSRAGSTIRTARARSRGLRSRSRMWPRRRRGSRASPAGRRSRATAVKSSRSTAATSS